MAIVRICFHSSILSCSRSTAGRSRLRNLCCKIAIIYLYPVPKNRRCLPSIQASLTTKDAIFTSISLISYEFCIPWSRYTLPYSVLSFALRVSEHLVVNVKVEPDQVMDLIQAAHFLGINSLLNVAATMVAHHLAGNV